MSLSRKGRQRLYIDNTVWAALGSEGELRQALQSILKQLLQDNWTFVTSVFAINQIESLSFDTVRFVEYLQLIRQICGEIESTSFDDLEKSSNYVVTFHLPFDEAVHVQMANRTKCDAMFSLSANLKRQKPLKVFCIE